MPVSFPSFVNEIIGRAGIFGHGRSVLIETKARIKIHGFKRRGQSDQKSFIPGDQLFDDMSSDPLFPVGLQYGCICIQSFSTPEPMVKVSGLEKKGVNIYIYFFFEPIIVFHEFLYSAIINLQSKNR